MDNPRRARVVAGRLPAIGLAAALAIGLCSAAPAAAPQLRGIWMHANFIRTPAEADRCVDKLQRANFNAVFLLVWYWGGQASFQTQFCPMLEGVQPGYDPLQYMIRECRRRQIEVHAWFVNGAYGAPKPRSVLDRHPDWVVQGDGRADLWYDFGQPEVRRFQSDLMIETLTKYDLDGIHFDFIRYNGPAYCFCKHCQAEFAARYGCGPIDRPQGVSLPLAAVVAGNPVAKPTTAKVLAQFSDGTPAIALNELGQGKVLLLNWHAARPMLPPVAETIRRTLRQWQAAPDKTFIIDTAPNRARYGHQRTAEAAEALQKLGYHAAITPEDRLGKLPAHAVVILPEVYLIPDDVAGALEQLVRSGGRLLVIDGPILSISNPAVRRVLGMTGAGKYINRTEAIQPVGKSELVDSSGPPVDLEMVKRRTEKWAEYRKAGVSELVRDVYQRAKRAKPGAQVTAAVFASLASAESVYQDWPGWIRQGIIDYVIPMAYTPQDAVLAKQLQEWATVDERLERILPGLGIFTKVKESECYTPRDVPAVLAQYRLCMDRGARGTNFYSLDGTAANPTLLLGEPLIQALRQGPFKERVPAYRPPARGPSK
jgi:uncharacterized lipoprotein YddW (UPF0748 family)